MGRTKQLLKMSAKKFLPSSLFQRIQAVRSRRHQVRFLASNGLLDQVKRHIEKNGTVVQSGPFAGLIYPIDAAVNRWSVPKMLGSYEMELHPFIHTAAGRKYDCVIDIGSAEGYYAAGLARLLGVPVLAFEPEPKEKSFSILLAKNNGVSHLVEMADLFTVENMRQLANKRAFVVCDCEGFEEVLFRPDTLELTNNWDLIIELHGTADAVLPSLNWPHSVTIVRSEQRSGLTNEYRTIGQRFLWCDSQPATDNLCVVTYQNVFTEDATLLGDR
jgi:hypothetical protein